MKPSIYITAFLILFMNSSYAQEANAEFELCPEMNTWPYYRYLDLNKRSFGEIKQYFKEDFSNLMATELPNNSGIITIQFKINCAAEIGAINASSCDLNYLKHEINPEITNYFLKKVQELKGWKEPIDDEGNSGNAHKFYSFRIVQGELTEILPK